MENHTISIVIILVSILMSAYFSATETAFSSLNRIRMKNMAEKGNKRARLVMRLSEDYDSLLSTILIGNNIVNLSASSVATTFAIRTWGSHAVGFMTGALTLTILMFGEIVPKTWAMLSSDKIALAYCGIINGLMQVMTPVIFVVDKMSNGILRLLHIDPSKKITTMTEAELRTYVDVSHESGVIESEEKEMIYNVFDFSDALAKELQQYVKKATAPYKYPRVVEFVTELPKTISGKIRRVEIRAKDSGVEEKTPVTV